jgi:hypothetical protein
MFMTPCFPCSRLSEPSDAVVAGPGDMTTIVVHCSDGRFGNSCDRFIRGHLQQTMYDRLVVPGGAAWLANRAELSAEAAAAREALRLLVDVHRLSHVVLIAHAGCAFYLQKLRVLPERCESRQRSDLIAVGRWLRSDLPHLHVSAYYAHRRGRRVELKPIFGVTDSIPEVRLARFPLPLWQQESSQEELSWRMPLGAGHG